MLYFASISLHCSCPQVAPGRYVNECVETRGAGAHGRGQADLADISSRQPPVRRAIVPSDMGARAASQEPAAVQAALRLAADDGFAVPDVRPRHARADPLR